MLCIIIILFICIIIIIISIYNVRHSKRLIDNFAQGIEDIQLSIFEKIPDKLKEFPIGISARQSALCMFVTDKNNNVPKNPTVGYALDTDIPYLNAFQNLFDFQTKLIDSFDSKACDLIFLKAPTESKAFKDLNSKYGIYTVNISSPSVSFWFPFSQKRKLFNDYRKNIVETLFIPSIIINPKAISLNEEASLIFNMHIGRDVDKTKLQRQRQKSQFFSNIWWSRELADQSLKIDFQLMKYNFKEVDRNKSLIIYDDIMVMIGDRIILSGQFNENMNDYYYVTLTEPITLTNYLVKKSNHIDEFTLMNGDRVFFDNKMYIYQYGDYIKEKKPVKKPMAYYDCVNKSDYSVNTSYNTKEACESEYDVYGEKRSSIDTMWFKRCKNNIECEYYNKGYNKFRGGCNNGICDKPLMKDDNKLYYGNNPEDYAFEEDTYDRIEQGLKPILNLNS